MKESFTLKRTAWHVQLMKYIWGWTPNDFTHICPYFWMSVLNLIICPFVFTAIQVAKLSIWLHFKLIPIGNIFVRVFTVVGGALEGASGRFQSAYEERERERYQKMMHYWKEHPEDLDRVGKLSWRSFQKLSNYTCTVDYSTFLIINDARRSYNVKKANKIPTTADCRPKQAARTNKQIISKIVKVIKPITMFIVYTLAAVVACVVLCLLFFLFKWLIVVIMHCPPVNWLFIASIILCIVGAFLVATILYLLIKYAVRPLFKYWIIPVFDRIINASKFWCKVWCTITWPFMWVARGVSTLFEIIKAMIQDNCPAIEWIEEESVNLHKE